MRFRMRSLGALAIAAVAVFVAPAPAAFASDSKTLTCSPDGGAHTAYIRLHVLAGYIITGYEIKYHRKSGFALGVHNNEWYETQQVGVGSGIDIGPDNGKPEVWTNRDSSFADVTISSTWTGETIWAWFDKAHADDPSCKVTFYRYMV